MVSVDKAREYSPSHVIAFFLLFLFLSTSASVAFSVSSNLIFSLLGFWSLWGDIYILSACSLCLKSSN